MQNLQDVVVAIVAFIILIGVMVVVHEFGHFAVAKLCGVRVESFSVGFGPRLFGVKYGDTDYKVCLLPLGGYVKMTGRDSGPDCDPGEDGAAVSPDDPGAFTAHPRWQRMLIGVAGPVANFILAFVLMVFYFAFINEVPLHETTSTTIEWVAADSVAAQAGFKPGDSIQRFGTVVNPDWEKIDEQANFNFSQIVPVTVVRDGTPVQLSLALPPTSRGTISTSATWGLSRSTCAAPLGFTTYRPARRRPSRGFAAEIRLSPSTAMASTRWSLCSPTCKPARARPSRSPWSGTARDSRPWS